MHEPPAPLVLFNPQTHLFERRFEASSPCSEAAESPIPPGELCGRMKKGKKKSPRWKISLVSLLACEPAGPTGCSSPRCERLRYPAKDGSRAVVVRAVTRVKVKVMNCPALRFLHFLHFLRYRYRRVTRGRHRQQKNSFNQSLQPAHISFNHFSLHARWCTITC